MVQQVLECDDRVPSSVPEYLLLQHYEAILASQQIRCEVYNEAGEAVYEKIPADSQAVLSSRNL